ncbi:MAG: methylamine utilization protein [Planctomycetaceae bacterium]
MLNRLLFSAVALAAFSVSSASAQETGTLKAQFVYGGSAFDPTALVPDKDTEFCGKHKLVNERLLINKSNNGIQNVVFQVYTGRGGSKLEATQHEAKTVTLANNQCRFEPRVVLLQVGDTLEITNPDPIGHNANLNFFANTAQNLLIPPGAKKEIAIEKAEPGVVRVDCNIHPWMTAQVVALDHPFAAVSDADGMIEIKNLPAGKALVFRINHEAADSGIKEVKIGNKTETLKKNNIEIMIKPGMNDLGKITIPADTLKP